MPNASVISVNVSSVERRTYGGEPVATGIFKRPVAGPVAVRGINLAGDDQADRANHGGPYRACYAYAREDYAWWEARLQRALPPGLFGENLTTAALDVSGAVIGERWRIGTAEFVVTCPRVPCYKLALAMDEPRFVREFARAQRPGAYLAIVAEGTVAAGDEARVVSRPGHGLTIATMFRIYLFEPDRLAEMLVPDLPPPWRDWVHERLGDA